MLYPPLDADGRSGARERQLIHNRGRYTAQKSWPLPDQSRSEVADFSVCLLARIAERGILEEKKASKKH
jgi:hypothetical protein